MPSNTNQRDESHFEAEVLRIARALFARENEYQGSTYIGNQERDGVFIGADLIVIVECTVSRRLDKAQHDGKKLLDACKQKAREHEFKAIKGYFVTRDEPTADQRRAIKNLGGPLVACSFTQFRNKLIDSSQYLELRDAHYFGSARDPETGKHKNLRPYVPVDPVEEGINEPRSLSAVVDEIKGGRSVLLHGDYGSGKSMFLRQLYLEFAKSHRLGHLQEFPIHLNLREHQDQTDPVEALERHARRIAFEFPSQLVRAWRSGGVILILDGFDEMAKPGWIGKISAMRDIRRRSVELLQNFCQGSRGSNSVVLAGRSHFFDSPREMKSALDIDAGALILLTGEPSASDVKAILSTYGSLESLPDWLPSRPLLLSYLGSSAPLQGSIEETFGYTAGEGWDMMLDRIAEREASMNSNLDGYTIRLILERLATQARNSADGLGPISEKELTSIYRSVCGHEPDDKSYQILQRLPGLGAMDGIDGSRRFIDVALVDAARAGDVVSCILEPHADNPLLQFKGSITALESVGLDVAAARLAKTPTASPGGVFSAIGRYKRRGTSDAIIADIVRVATRLWPDFVPVDEVSIHEVEIHELSFNSDAERYDWLSFYDCLISELNVSDHSGYPLPLFQDCMFGRVIGATGETALPDGQFLNCQFDQFDVQTLTTSGILSLQLDPIDKVILTILKKIYAQRGSGRVEGALYRSLDAKHKSLVPDAIVHLIASELIAPARSGGRKVYLPVRGMSSRARRILQAPQSSNDDVFKHS